MTKSLGIILMLVAAGFAQDDRGTALFNKTCARCHGTDGRARTPAAAKMLVANLRSKDVQGMSDQELFDTIAYGTKHKEYPHAFLYHGLTKDDVHTIIRHIRSFKENH
jgi:mono/diheme cytochrome c family protein